MKLLLIIATFVVIIKSIPIDNSLGTFADNSEYRLDGLAIPSHYELEITPYFFDELAKDQFTFHGKVEILLIVTENTESIRLNAKYLQISPDDIKMLDAESVEIDIKEIDMNETYEILTITFNGALQKDAEYTLFIEYTGEMGEDNRGFYRSSYIEEDDTEWLGATQLQVTHARRIFPCFDEPEYKATISLTIKDIPLNYKAISNADVKSTDSTSSTQTIQFKKTPKMSTYLLAFVVSKFEAFQKTSGSILSVYGRPTKVDNLKYAQEIGEEILKALEDYLEFNYTDMEDGDDDKLTKLDMVAVPDRGGAMENWGLLTYQELYLLYDKDFTTPARIPRIAGIIAHEQAHLWFGDLVTCQWWDNAWLNEGFAQYFQYHIPHMVDPTWDMDKLFVVEQLHSALLFDSTDATHPMSHQADTPEEASAMFSSISYNKAASIIRMIKHIISEEKFVAGLRKYLKLFKYQNTVPENLLDQFDNPDIKTIAQSWIENSNYPLVTVTYDKETKKANVKQTTFKLKNTETPVQKLWSIPLTYTSGELSDFEDTSPKEILRTDSIDIPIDTEDNWLIFNIQQTGFYRVNYDENGWNLIKAALFKENHDDIHELNRAQIVDDLFNLARSEVITYDLAFSVLDYLRTEEHYLPWLAAFNGFSYLLNKLDSTQIEMFKVYLFKLLHKSYKSFKLEVNTEVSLRNLQNINVFAWLCKLGHVQCEFESNKILKNGLTVEVIHQIPIQLRQSVICRIAKNKDFEVADFNMLWEYSENHLEEQESVITALSCATKEIILIEYFDKVLDKTKVRHHFRRTAFDSVYTQSIENVQFALDYLTEYHQQISDGFNDKSAVITTISSLAARFTKLEQIIQVEQFYIENSEEYKVYESRINDILSQARADLDWSAKHFSTLPLEVRTAYYRLEETIIPVNYDIEITPYLEKDNEFNKAQFTFDGKVRIELLSTEESRNTLRLNAKNLNIHSSELFDGSGSKISEPSYVSADEFLTIYFDTNLEANKQYFLTFEYTGSMDLDMHGFYRSSYVQNGVTEYLGSTQMQTTHARRVFPGFDEPEYKATFNLIINKPIEYEAYSNMNPIDPTAQNIPGVTTYNQKAFKQTPQMSTYLLAFTVAKFERRFNEENSFGVISRPDQYDQTLYAYTDGITTLEKLEQYLDYPYYQSDIEKLDMIAIPDFSAGAMENWGLITYRESNILYDAEYTTLYTKQRILAVIAHEQAHLWFGDLVTCKWWEYTWLNEGFATYFQYFGAHLVQPSWEIDKQFVVEQVHTAMLFDSNESSHPMSSTVNSPAEAAAIFDNISYNKAGSIIRMIRHLIGDTNFQKALQAYLNNNKYGSSIPDKLFYELNKVAEVEYPDLIQIITPWTTQSHYPVITVEYDSETQQATITQKTFLLNKSATVDNTWSIPLTYTSRGNGFDILKPEHILNTKSINIPMDVTDSWIIFNLQQTGFYRVNYDEEGWNLIKTGLQSQNHDDIHEINRAQIVDDLLNLARANELDYKFVFSMLHYLKTETHYLPWQAAFTNFAFLTSKMNQTQLDVFKPYLIRLLSKSYAEVGWTESTTDSALKIYHRANVINWLCRSNYQDCINRAKILYDEFKTDETKLVPVNIRGPVFCSVMRNGGEDDLEFLWAKFLEQEIATEKNIIAQAIGCASEKVILYKAIDLLLSNNSRSQDKRTMLTYTFTQTEGNVQHVLDYVTEHYENIIEGFDNDVSAVITTIIALANRFTNDEQIVQVEEFFEFYKAKFRTYAVRIENAMLEARANLIWNDENVKNILDQIELNQKNDPEESDGGATTITFSFLLISLLSLCTMYN